MNVCKICDRNAKGNEYSVKEMMLGIRSRFTYFECECCGCLQLKDIPENISQYYPSLEYYSLRNSGVQLDVKFILIKRLIVWTRLSSRAKILSSIGALFSLRFKEYLKWINYIEGLSYKSKILDVGCGNGILLSEMRQLGFRNLSGIDPFIHDGKDENGINIIKGNLKDIKGSYDLIMLHHSLEHIPDQDQLMKQLNQLLPLGGMLLIRIPLVDCFAWRRYGESWYQIDAPRHFFLHSSRSLVMLAKKYGFDLMYSYRDSTELQFSISEMYAKDISCNDLNSKQLTVDIKENKKRAALLNSHNDGDQGCFIFKKRQG